MSPEPAIDPGRKAGNLRGILWMLGATFVFVNMHAAIRHLAPQVDPMEIAFFRNILGLIFLAPVFLRYGFEPLRTRLFRLHVWRAAINLVNMITYYMGLRLTPLAEATALNFTAPLFATVLAALLLGEKLRLRRSIALAAGFAGALVVVRPGFEALNPGALLVIFSALLWGGIMVMIKIIGRSESSLTITLWVLILMTVMSLPPALLVWQWPTAGQWGWLAFIAVTGTIGQLLLAQALKDAEASAIMPVDFCRLIWAALTGYLAFGEVPDLFTWTGGVMIFASATYIAFREKRLHRKPKSS